MKLVSQIISLFGKLNPLKAINTISKVGNHAKLISDTFEYYKKEGVQRGLLSAGEVQTVTGNE